MNAYELTYTKRAKKGMLSLPLHVARLIRDKLRLLEEDPYAPIHNATKLQGRSGYRLRIGDWWVIYEIDNDRLVILVLDVGQRGGIYQ